MSSRWFFVPCRPQGSGGALPRPCSSRACAIAGRRHCGAKAGLTSWSVVRLPGLLLRITGCSALSPRAALGSMLVQSCVQDLSGAMFFPGRMVHFGSGTPGDGRGCSRPPSLPATRVALSDLSGRAHTRDELNLLRRQLDGLHLGRRCARLSKTRAAALKRTLMPMIPASSYKRRRAGLS